ncbi:MAG TPA: sulfide/dihydroorotate dehydrogenase-like FAD/NAD-binding protein, partial [Sporomusaceae bacterium]|nr:sulfide/dihydroorotate dehydrogenase-like FAD/NAD-binding protein [Sporomusaceae bacterium]
TRPHGIHTIVSLNPIMVDGTGMCGGCRVNVANENKFACVDGPEFDAHEVDFAGLMARQRMYHNHEKQERPQGGNCKCHG